MIFFYIFLGIFLAYSALIIYYWIGWASAPEYRFEPVKNRIPVSVIIPARNEERNIGNLLKSLSQQTYPSILTEIIVVNDDSEDGTGEIVQQFSHVHLLNMDGAAHHAHKKRAIEKGIAISKGKLTITTDADCIPSYSWIETLVSMYEHESPVLMVAPVVIENNTSLLQIFQALDFLVLQGITGASVVKNYHVMGNGANLCYEKDAFEKVEGFRDVDHISSGDDMLLIGKIKKRFPGRVRYLKSKQAIVYTQPMDSWKRFFNQRIRWASKARSYQEPKIFIALLLVYLTNLGFLVLLVAGFWYHRLWIYLIVGLTAKTMVEFPFVYSVARYFNRQSLLKYFPLFQPLHILYTIMAGWFGQFRKYEWKGRMVH